MKKKILIAAALPYANGSLHLGHVAGLIGSDVLARYFRIKGDDVLFVSGSDCYGTPIVFEAEKQNSTPSSIAEKYHQEFQETLIDGMNFSYDFYTKTTSKEHHKTVQKIFTKLFNDGYIYKKTENLPYCPSCEKFLPDRYIEGKCYLCGFDSARGDQCDNCGNLMNTKELIKPKCKTCENTPKWKSSEHFFLKLTSLEKDLKKWVKESKGWRIGAKNFTFQLLLQGLHDRSITRDTLWGVPVPIKGYERKKIYVWFEAVCGYLSASKEWSKKIGKDKEWEKYWKNKNAIHYYVHGKDNIPFHSIIWPSILLGYKNLHLPDRIISSEYLTLEKKQLSKSRNWAIWIPDFLKNFDCDTLRYYLIANGSETSDSDFSWNEFSSRTNNELIGNFGNYIYRVLSFIEKNFKEGVSFSDDISPQSHKFLALAEKTFPKTSILIEEGKFRKALQEIFKLAEEGNRFIDNAKPWATIKENPKKAEKDLAVAAHIVKCISILINPFLPTTSEEIHIQLGEDFSDIKWEYPLNKKIKPSKTKPIYKKIEKELIEEELSKLKKQSTEK